MFDFNKCHPIELNDLVRIGNEYDGGYIVTKSQIERTEIVLSFGIRDEWSFEYEFSKRKDVKIYSYDYFTNEMPFLSEKFSRKFINTILGAGINILRMRPYKVKHYLGTFQRGKDFNDFFDGKKRHFIPKFLGRSDNEQNICFRTIFKGLGNVEDLSVFLKMDIEGAEFQTLPELMPYLHTLNGMGIEFHIGPNINEFEDILELFSKDFYVAHIHGCNFAGYIQNTNIPSVLEMSFINKKIAPEKIMLSRLEYPVKGLDAPCDRDKKDYTLTFTN